MRSNARQHELLRGTGRTVDATTSFPRSAWERDGLPLRGQRPARSTQSVSLVRSHAERGNERRGGLTLIELLIVIIILTTLVTAAIPILTPTNDDRRLREASRAVNAYISGAQMKAIQLQRPYGVMIKRLSQDTNADGNAWDSHEDNAVSVELQYVEQPSPFVGFSETSSARVALYEPANATWYGGLSPLVRIQFVTRGSVNLKANDGLPDGWDADPLPDATIRPGDVIEFGGTRYELLSDTRDTGITPDIDDSGFFTRSTGASSLMKAPQIAARPLNDTGQILNVQYDDGGNVIGTPGADDPPFFTHPAPYKILRQPMPSSAEPLQLPDATAIDLRASGVGINDYFYLPRTPSATDFRDNREPVVIMFAPEGRVSRMRYVTNDPTVPSGNDSRVLSDQPVVDNIFLLVGRREIAPPPAVDADLTLDASPPPPESDANREARGAVNWLRDESRWIGIGSQSGRVVTVENAFVNLDNLSTYTSATEEKRNAQIQTARTFARQMSQLGGR